MQNMLTAAATLSDRELLERLPQLARSERRASAGLVAHLAELDGRPLLYAREGYSSLFAYCTGALHFSEDAACSRIEAARACRRFPCLLERLAPLAPARYRVQFTMGPEAHARLRKLQTLLRRAIPSGDPAEIVDRALILLLAKVEARKLGAARRPRAQAPARPRTAEDAPEGTLPSRDVPNAVKRVVWSRDGGQCAFVSASGRRCQERVFLEFHHQRPYALRVRARRRTSRCAAAVTINTRPSGCSAAGEPRPPYPSRDG